MAIFSDPFPRFGRGGGGEPGTVMGPEHNARSPKGAPVLSCTMYSSASKFELVSKLLVRRRGVPEHIYVSWGAGTGTYSHMLEHSSNTRTQYARTANQKRRFG